MVYNGNYYIPEALKNGAVAVASEEYIDWHDDSVSYIKCGDIDDAMARCAKNLYADYLRKIRLTAVTGTNGKTSFVSIASQLYNFLGKKSAFTGTLGTNIINCCNVLPQNTTYNPAIYHELILCAVTDGVKNIFSEVSSQGLAAKRCRYIDFNASVFLNLTQDHLDFHKDMESYYNCKKILFEETNGLQLINTGDYYGNRLAKEMKRKNKPVVPFGAENDADYRITDIADKKYATEFVLRQAQHQYKFIVPLCGTFQAYNITPIIILLFKDGYSANEIQLALDHVKPVPGRMECIYKGRPKVYLDYAHTPDALCKALKYLKKNQAAKLTCVFGCGGNRDHTKRALMGEIATEYADRVILTDDNPRDERSAKILSEIIGQLEKDNYIVIPNRADAIIYALDTSRDEETVLIAGKGHETYQVYSGVSASFSYRNTVKDYFAQKNKCRL
jgi:UDP-N-acetylmuramoyl-L-alanyl-D-glutamate--2,6-diaminopimelate ligase